MFSSLPRTPYDLTFNVVILLTSLFVITLLFLFTYSSLMILTLSLPRYPTGGLFYLQKI